MLHRNLMKNLHELDNNMKYMKYQRLVVVAIVSLLVKVLIFTKSIVDYNMKYQL